MEIGRSKLKLFYNPACTRELEKGPGDFYIFSDIVISNNAQMPYTTTIWCKNDGTHKAYSVSVKLIKSNIENPILTIDTEFESLDVKPLRITFNIEKNDLSKKTLELVVDYDNV